MPLQHQPDRFARGLQCGIVELAFTVDRRDAGGREQAVALAQRHVEPIGQTQHHLAAGHRAAGLDEAQVARRHVGVTRQVELTQAPPLAPLAQLRTEGARAAVFMLATIAQLPTR